MPSWFYLEVDPTNPYDESIGRAGLMVRAETTARQSITLKDRASARVTATTATLRLRSARVGLTIEEVL